jgi:hypothetical protein
VSLWLFIIHHSCILVVVHHSSSTIVIHCSRVFVVVVTFWFYCYWSVLVVVHHSRSYSAFKCIRCYCFPIWLPTILKHFGFYSLLKHFGFYSLLKHFGCCLSLYSCSKMFITQVRLLSPILFVCVYHLRFSYFVEQLISFIVLGNFVKDG